MQGVAVTPQGYVVPTLDGTVLHVTPKGKTSMLADLLKADFGIPFAIVLWQDDAIVTVSDFIPRHHLIQISPDGKLKVIADLSEVSGFYGAPFGVAVSESGYIVSLSTDVVESTSVLLRVSSQGDITKIADLSRFGNPFAVVADDRDFVIAQQKGQLLRMSASGDITVLVNLVELGLGIPFGVAVKGKTYFATTNSGLIVRIKPDGTASTVVNLLSQKLGIPSGIAISGSDLIATTNSGYLLRIRNGSL